MNRCILYILLLLATLGHAQSGFLPGYVLNNKGDTVKGKIKDRKFVNGTQSWQKIRFIDSAGKKYAYDPEEIKEYGRTGRTRYRSLVVGVEAKPTFLELQEEGAVLLYAYNHGSWGGAGNAVLMKTGKDDAKEHVEFFLQKRNVPASLMQWRPRDYKKTAQFFFNDEPGLLREIEEGKLTEEDIRTIVQRYNVAK